MPISSVHFERQSVTYLLSGRLLLVSDRGFSLGYGIRHHVVAGKYIRYSGRALRLHPGSLTRRVEERQYLSGFST